MIQIGRALTYYSLTIGLVIGALAIPTCSADQRKDSLSAYVQSFEGNEYVLRPRLNHSRFVYPDPPLDTSFVFAEFKDERGFLYHKRRPIHIVSVDLEEDGVRLEFKYKSLDLGWQTLELVSPTDSLISVEVCQGLLNQLFEFKDVTYPRYWMDTLNRSIHLRGANHINEHCILADSTAVSQSSYRQCPACFQQISEIPDIAIEYALREGALETFLMYNPVSYNDSLQELVQSAASRVLANWPLPLRGYHYEFYVTNSTQLNALAFPAGLIYLHKGVLDLVEDSVQLEAILAHEIAHVEMRHAYNTLLKSQKKGLLSGILSIGVGVLAGATANDADIGGAVTALSMAVATVSNELSMAGYNRDQEIQADNLASTYLSRVYGSSRVTALQDLLQKMMYAENCAEHSLKAEVLSSHPKTLARRKSIRDIEVLPISTAHFVGVDTCGREVARCSIVGVSRCRRQLQEWRRNTQWSKNDRSVAQYHYSLYAAIETTEFLYQSRELKHMDVWMGDVKLRFDNKQDTRFAPLTGGGCILEMTATVDDVVSGVQRIDAEFGMPLDWKKVDSF